MAGCFLNRGNPIRGERSTPFLSEASSSREDEADDEKRAGDVEWTPAEREEAIVLLMGMDADSSDEAEAILDIMILAEGATIEDLREEAGRYARGEMDEMLPDDYGQEEIERIAESEEDERYVPIDQTSRNDVLWVIRSLFSDGLELDRDGAIRAVAGELGYGRVGHRIRDVLGNDLRTAVRRGILANDRGIYFIDCKSIDDYPLDLLVEQLLASMERAWTTRDDAIAGLARHLGFKRTGSRINKAGKSAINAAIRRGLAEKNGRDLIRKL